MTEIREVCSLSEEELAVRRAALGRGLLAKVRERRALRDGMLFRFDVSPGMREALDEFLAFERGCCPSLGLRVRESAGALELEIRGLDPESSFLTGMPATALDRHSGSNPDREADEDPQPPSRWRRALSAIGLGTVAALTLCCVVPVAAVALFGVALAAPFTRLDSPWTISSIALGLAAGVWLWRQRRDVARRARLAAGAKAATGSDVSCSIDGGCGC